MPWEKISEAEVYQNSFGVKLANIFLNKSLPKLPVQFLLVTWQYSTFMFH
jgi:hypothetical protein